MSSRPCSIDVVVPWKADRRRLAVAPARTRSLRPRSFPSPATPGPHRHSPPDPPSLHAGPEPRHHSLLEVR